MAPVMDTTTFNLSNVNDSLLQSTFYNLNASGSAFKSLIAHYLMGIAGMAVCALGVIGNTLCIAVLTRRNMRQSTTNQYLIALAVSDMLVLLFSVWTNLKDTRLSEHDELQFVTWKNVPFVPLTYPYAHSFCITFQVASVWLTVAFATDRYFMICHPFVSERYCSNRLSRFSILAIFLLALAYSVPRFFEHKIFVQDLGSYPAFPNHTSTSIIQQNSVIVSHAHNSSVFSDEYMQQNNFMETEMHYMQQLPKVIIWYYVTDFGHSEGFTKSYHLVSWVVLVVCLPLISIAIMNIFLILEVRRSYKRGQQINVVERRRQDTNVMLIGVIVIFFVCQVPAGASHVVWAIIDKKSFHFPTFLFNEISNFLVILNSAINIVPYYLFGRKFRKELLRIFCRKCVSQDYLRRLSMNAAALTNRPVSPLACQMRKKRSVHENHNGTTPTTTTTAMILQHQTHQQQNNIRRQVDDNTNLKEECKAFLLNDDVQPEAGHSHNNLLLLTMMNGNGGQFRRCSF